jgi:hypothetical protein
MVAKCEYENVKEMLWGRKKARKATRKNEE